ncbi:MAG: aminodeoxychorismate synthase component I [Candidatus Omnitrophica bacterium]|nr:aminodeoxychorismate synthase component I [Candidatus Omnitrophota bacterium]
MEKYLPPINRSCLIERIPLWRPVEEVFSYFAERPYTSLLHSSLRTDAGRYSFLGIDPFLVMRSKGRKITVETGRKTRIGEGDVFECLKRILNTYRVDNPTSFPLISGGMGYFSYDLKDLIEDLPRRAVDDLALPESCFCFFRTILIHDRKDPGCIHISITSDGGETRQLLENYKAIMNGTRKEGSTLIDSSKAFPGLCADISRKDYLKKVEKVLDYIRAGDIYQACLSQRFTARWPLGGYSLYQRLNRKNPAPFSAYLNLPEAKVLSSSPERFLRVADGQVETRPMKGTRSRGSCEASDRKMREDLVNSSKDAAELAMIVDLERNDLGKVCVPGSIRVTEHRRVETYPTVFQTISVVRGLLAKDTSLGQIVKASFPGGSISGCPKVRAMEIIDELEPTARSVYTGSIGYMSFHGTMDLNMAIRTMLLKQGRVYFQTGGGIVADSDPEEEYEETLHKARAMMEIFGKQ